MQAVKHPKHAGNHPDKQVYFIQNTDTGSIKIGNSVDPGARLKSLQCGSDGQFVLLGSISGGRKEEAEIHTRFASYRMSGEWFNPSKELMEYIKSTI